MCEVPKRYIVETLVFIVCATFVVVVYAIASSRAESRYIEAVRTRISDVREELLGVAALVRNNRADATTASVFSDCAERDAYEKALDRLLESSREDLVVTKALFLSCGYRDAVRKEVMALQLSDTLSLYSHLNELLSLSRGTSEYQKNVEIWNTIVQLERERSALLGEQVKLQGRVIDVLGKEQSPEEMLREAKEIQQSLEVKFHQITALMEEERRAWSLAEESA